MTVPASPASADPPEASAEKAIAAISAHVLAALGRPPGFSRVAVVRLWRGSYRVNVVIGADAATVRIAHSFFVETTAGGEVLSSSPPLTRAYP